MAAAQTMEVDRLALDDRTREYDLARSAAMRTADSFRVPGIGAGASRTGVGRGTGTGRARCFGLRARQREAVGPAMWCVI